MNGFSARAVPNLVVFLSGLAIMVLELVAARLVAKHLGSSLETWTTVIGVILAGMSLGNYWGGRLSDLRNPLATLPYLMGGAALLCASVLWTNDWVGGAALMAELPRSVRVLLTIALIFFPPACLLGTIQPTVARWAIEQSVQTGGVIGNIGAWGTIGNILGTFLTGFVLLAAFGVRSIVLYSAAILAVTALGLLLLSRIVAPESVREEPRVRRVERAASDGEADAWWVRAMPNLFVFTSGMSIMVLELVGSRFVSREMGTSIYTWTSLIGVVLAGVSLGNYIGGYLADRYAPARLLPHLFLVSSILAATLLKAPKGLENPSIGHELLKWAFGVGSEKVPEGTLLAAWMLPGSIFMSVLVSFFPASCALGTISPVSAKLALERARRAGTAIGNVYAWGAIGSILGTFLTGFVLISSLGTHAVVCAVAGLLALISVSMVTSGLLHAVWAGMVMAGCIAALAPAHWTWVSGMGDYLNIREKPEEGYYVRESNYYSIKVYPPDEDDSRTLVLDNLIHGYVVKDRPRTLEYDYERIYASVMERAGAIPVPEQTDESQAVPPSRPLRTFFIGGGSYTYPRYIEACYPGSTMLVAEIDPAVRETAHEALYLPRDTKIETRVGDARSTVDQVLAENERLERAGKAHEKLQFDFIFGDAFNDFSVPWHLTTLEFNEKIKKVLAPGGVYMINIIDNYRYSKFLGAYVQTARKTFPGVAVFSTEHGDEPPERRETFVITMSHEPLDLENLGDRAGERPFEGSVLKPEHVEEAVRRSRFGDPDYRRRYLTDEQVEKATAEATAEWQDTKERLEAELDRVTRRADGKSKTDEHRIKSVRRELRQHNATKQRQIDDFMNKFARQSDTLSAEQLARVEQDLRALPEVILTDDYAPVENLLAPVARER